MSALQISPHRSSAPEAGLHAAGRAAGDEGGCRCHIGGTHVPEQDNRLVEPQPTVQPGFSLVAHDWSQHPRPALRPEHERQFSSCFVHSSTAPATLLSVLNTPTSNTHRTAHTARSACYRTVPPRGPPRVRLSALLHAYVAGHGQTHGRTRLHRRVPRGHTRRQVHRTRRAKTVRQVVAAQGCPASHAHHRLAAGDRQEGR